MSGTAFERILPEVTDQNRHFWCGGEDGKLHMLRCDDCRHVIHPPLPICTQCRSRALSVQALSGEGRVATFTINHQPWFPSLPVPYCVAIVELDEQPGLHLTSNIVNSDLNAIHIGMRVRVRFEQHQEVWLPLFEPATLVKTD